MKRAHKIYIGAIVATILLALLYLVYLYFSLLGLPDKWINGPEGTPLPVVETTIDRDAPSIDLSEVRKIFIEQPDNSIQLQGRDVILLSKWNSWYPLNVFRLVGALFVPELRYEHGIHAYYPEDNTSTYLFPGLSPLVSPDHTKVLFTKKRSGDYEYILWNTDIDTFQTLITLTERDPGSGASFAAGWTGESTIRILGDARDMNNFILEYSTIDNTLQRVQ